MMIGNIVEKAPIVDFMEANKQVDAIFRELTDTEGVVVTRDEQPVGIIMRSQFYQKIGTEFGFALYMNRSIEIVVDHDPLIIDYATSITDVSKIAMDRPLNHLYDYIIITKNGDYYGIVSIKNLLLKFVEVEINRAKFMNPLTGLPGNNLIDEKLKETLLQEKFSIYYIDLDQFKTFNDTYGFLKGDQIICETAAILDTCIQPGLEEAFLGHIGGDDFLAITYNHDYTRVCEMIMQFFNEKIKKYYKEEEWERGYVSGKDRLGNKVNIPLVSISIAVLTNKETHFQTVDQVAKVAAELKKQCKNINKSCYLVSSF